MKKIQLAVILIIFVVYESYSQNNIDLETRRTVINNGIGLGSVIAGVTSWERNKSVLLAIIHGFFSWLYVIYFVLTRKKGERN
jgi:hypothetical protein